MHKHIYLYSPTVKIIHLAPTRTEGGICKGTDTVRRPPRPTLCPVPQRRWGTLYSSQDVCQWQRKTLSALSLAIPAGLLRTTTTTPPLHTHTFFPIIKRGDRLHQWADDRPNQGPPVTARDLLTRPQHLSPLCLSLSPKLLTAPRRPGFRPTDSGQTAVAMEISSRFHRRAAESPVAADEGWCDS